MATTLCRLVLLTALCSVATAITVRRQPPMRQVHRFGTVPQVIRVRGGPVKRIYVPMNVMPQRYGPAYEPAHWKPKPVVKMYQQGPQAPNRILPQAWPGPMRKARNPKPKLSRKPAYRFPPKGAPAFDSYRPQPAPPAYRAPPPLTDSYTPQKTSYHLTAPTYGKPHPAGSPEPPKDKVAEEAPTSYMHVYQGDQATKEGKPTYGYTQSHAVFEDSKTSSPKTTNHRPVYKPKADTTEDPKQGSFQPPKQTFGFTPYEDSLKESSENYPPSYYKKQPDTVLSPNYFDQNKS